MSPDEEKAEFFRQWHPEMIRVAKIFGASDADAEDAAATVVLRICLSKRSLASVWNKRAYVRTAMRNELIRNHTRSVSRQENETRWASELVRSEAADILDRLAELDGVREFLTVLPQRLREIVISLYLEKRVDEIATALGISPAAVRRHRRNVRRTVKPLLFGDERRRWLLAGARLHEDFHNGEESPVRPRPVIERYWTELMKSGRPPARGTRVVLLDDDALRQRRHESLLPEGSPALAELFDVATRNELLAVVLDVESVVLHRGGHRDALAAADRLGFIEAARWNLPNAGVNAAGIAGLLDAPVTVNRWEHSCSDQHELSCLAIPLHLPHGRRVTVNLTSTAASATRVPRALHRDLHGIAVRLHRTLSAPAG